MTDLEPFVGRVVDIPAGRWAAARLIGEARNASNQGKSKPEHSRGLERDIRGHVIGVATELTQRSILQQIPGAASAIANLDANMYRSKGGRGIEGCDVVFDPNTGRGIDAKGSPCGDPDWWFYIADHKHDRLRNKCLAYFCIIAPVYAKRGILARLVPYDEVSQWRLGRIKPEWNPAYHLEMQDFLTRYCPPADLRAIAQDLYTQAQIQEKVQDGGLRDALRRYFPAMGDVLGGAA